MLNKVFTEFTHIVAIKTTGNVFSYEVCFNIAISNIYFLMNNLFNFFENKCIELHISFTGS